MTKKPELKAIAAALGTTFVVTLVASPIANAAVNPFGVVEFGSGYMVAGEEGKCGGEAKDAEGKCGGEAKDAEAEGDEAKDAEGKCGGEAKDAEGKCGS